MQPQEQPQRTPLPTRPDPYQEEGPRPIPGEPRRPRSPLDQYPDVWGHLRDDWNGPANSNPPVPPVTGESPRRFPYEAPLDPTLPAQSLMPEVVEHRYRATSAEAASAPEHSTAPVNPEDLPAEMEACANAMDALIQALRHGERSPQFQRQHTQLIEHSRRLLAAVRSDAAQSMTPEALNKKCAPLEQVIEEESRVLQWMYATAGVTRHSTDSTSSDLKPFFLIKSRRRSNG